MPRSMSRGCASVSMLTVLMAAVAVTSCEVDATPATSHSDRRQRRLPSVLAQRRRAFIAGRVTKKQFSVSKWQIEISGR